MSYVTSESCISAQSYRNIYNRLSEFRLKCICNCKQTVKVKRKKKIENMVETSNSKDTKAFKLVKKLAEKRILAPKNLSSRICSLFSIR